MLNKKFIAAITAIAAVVVASVFAVSSGAVDGGESSPPERPLSDQDAKLLHRAIPVQTVSDELQAAFGVFRTDAAKQAPGGGKSDETDFALNRRLAREVKLSGGGTAWLIPADGYVCLQVSGQDDPPVATAGPISCMSIAAAKAGWLIVGAGDEKHNTYDVGVVPDGVKSVDLTGGASDSEAAPEPAVVTSNVWSVGPNTAKHAVFSAAGDLDARSVRLP